jgi:hypothetical protein
MLTVETLGKYQSILTHALTLKYDFSSIFFEYIYIRHVKQSAYNPELGETRTLRPENLM